jgi:hypothetical protein
VIKVEQIFLPCKPVNNLISIVSPLLFSFTLNGVPVPPSQVEGLINRFGGWFEGYGKSQHFVYVGAFGLLNQGSNAVQFRMSDRLRGDSGVDAGFADAPANDNYPLGADTGCIRAKNICVRNSNDRRDNRVEQIRRINECRRAMQMCQGQVNRGSRAGFTFYPDGTIVFVSGGKASIIISGPRP